ncbi:hypothetical protein THOB06_190073 [Vibrio rotiferianus]|nr:hypothetical protein THOG10_190073 [Vibrio rotiferianus]CAH1571036.1 hypothetical protein THOB06_190073 [Vibrio rotiferianus]
MFSSNCLQHMHIYPKMLVEVILTSMLLNLARNKYEEYRISNVSGTRCFYFCFR